MAPVYVRNITRSTMYQKASFCSNHGSGVYKEHYAQYYVPKSFILLAGTGVWKISSVTCGFSSIKIDYSD